MKRFWPLVLLLVLGIASLALNRCNAQGIPLPTAPPAMDAEQIRTASEAQVVNLVITDLRWTLAELPPEERARWRSWPEAARHVQALSWTEIDNGPDVMPVFTGFADLLANPAAHVPTLVELSAAYTAIGAPAVAAIVDQAAGIAASAGIVPGEPVAKPEAFTVVDDKLRRQSTLSGVKKLLRTYVRAHAEEIAHARHP